MWSAVRRGLMGGAPACAAPWGHELSSAAGGASGRPATGADAAGGATPPGPNTPPAVAPPALLLPNKKAKKHRAPHDALPGLFLSNKEDKKGDGATRGTVTIIHRLCRGGARFAQ